MSTHDPNGTDASASDDAEAGATDPALDESARPAETPPLGGGEQRRVPTPPPTPPPPADPRGGEEHAAGPHS